MAAPLSGIDHVVEYIGTRASLDDLVVFPFIVLSSLYIFNRGSLWPTRESHHHKLFERPQMGLAIAEKPRKSRNILHGTQEINARVVVCWGSQSGFAEGLAHSLARDLHQRFGVQVLLADLSDYDAESFTLLPNSTPVIFIVSTYGEGDPSDNAQDFVSWSRAAQAGCLKNLSFAAFGCGNSNYQNYNKVVDDLQHFLTEAGAAPLIATGKGDEATRTSKEDFLDWKEDLVLVLSRELGLPQIEREYEPSVEVAEVGPKSSAGDVHIGAPCYKLSAKDSKVQSEIVKLPIVSKRSLAQYDEHDRNCFEVVANLVSRSDIKYRTGDHMAIWPENPDHDVRMLQQVLGLYDRKDSVITISLRDGTTDCKLPARTTIDTLFRHYLDICGPVSRETLQALALTASTPLVKNNLLAISQSKEKYLEHLDRNHLTFARVLRYTVELDPSASWKHLTLPFVVDYIPTMMPRLYSISSSATTSPRQVSLTVSAKPTPLAKNSNVKIPGLASTYLTGYSEPNTIESDISSASSVFAQIRHTNFKLPTNSTTPVIMVAAGSGIAPFRAFIQERARLKAVGRDVGDMILLFGCQRERNFPYRDELEAIATGPLKGLLRIICAFSRAGETREYVQDRVEAHSAEICDLLLKGDAAMYMCGAASMAQKVNRALENHIVGTEGWKGSYNAWKSQKKSGRRWFEDVWG